MKKSYLFWIIFGVFWIIIFILLLFYEFKEACTKVGWELNGENIKTISVCISVLIGTSLACMRAIVDGRLSVATLILGDVKNGASFTIVKILKEEERFGIKGWLLFVRSYGTDYILAVLDKEFLNCSPKEKRSFIKTNKNFLELLA